jgi:hypothetical protein
MANDPLLHHPLPFLERWLILVGQLPTGRIDITAPAPADACDDALLLQVLLKSLGILCIDILMMCLNENSGRRMHYWKGSVIQWSDISIS